MVTRLKKKHDISGMTEEEEAHEKLHGKSGLVPKRERTEKHAGKAHHKSGNVIMHTLGIVKQPRYTKTFAAAFILSAILYSFLYGLWKIPAIEFGINRLSAVGILDYLYLILISALAGLLFTLFKYGRMQSVKSGSTLAGGGGLFAGIVSTVCPACQGISIAALGGTVAALPLASLVPYIGLIQFITVFILGFALYLKANSIFTQTCISCNLGRSETSSRSSEKRSFSEIPKSFGFRESQKALLSAEFDTKFDTKIVHKEKPSGKEPLLYQNHVFAAVVALALLLIINNFMITGAFTAAGASSANGGSISIKPGFEYGPKLTLKPMPLASGESPRFQGYKSIVKPLPTISELEIAASTGDVTQDIINNVIPRGTPWYGQEAGVSFADPVAAATLWGKGRAIQLNGDEQKRWERIVNSFTCDYCCGSPQQPTIITRCGCAHSIAAQGMAKWFIKNYGDKYSDEEIYGEMARWYALWYPGPTVKRIVQELQAAS